MAGLTGGIACGKSAAAEIMRRNGWEVVSTDALAGQVGAAAGETDDSVDGRVERVDALEGRLQQGFSAEAAVMEVGENVDGRTVQVHGVPDRS